MANNGSPGASNPFQAREWLKSLRSSGGPSNLEYNWNTGREWARSFVRTPMKVQCEELIDGFNSIPFEKAVNDAMEATAKARNDREVLSLLPSWKHDQDDRKITQEPITATPQAENQVVVGWSRIHEEGAVSTLSSIAYCYTPTHWREAVEGLTDIFVFTRLFVQSSQYLCCEETADELQEAIEHLVHACHEYFTFCYVILDHALDAKRLCKEAVDGLEQGIYPDSNLKDKLVITSQKVRSEHDKLAQVKTDAEDARGILKSLAHAERNTLQTFESWLNSLGDSACSGHSKEHPFETLGLVGTCALIQRTEGRPDASLMSGLLTCHSWLVHNKGEMGNQMDITMVERAMMYQGALNGLSIFITIMETRVSKHKAGTSGGDALWFSQKNWSAMNRFYIELVDQSESNLAFLQRFFLA